MKSDKQHHIELDWIGRWATYAPDRVALKSIEDDIQITYKELYDWIGRMAEVLIHHYAIRKGDRVAVLSLNRVEHVALFYAVQRVGGILLPMNYRLAVPELTYQIEDAEPSLIVFEKEFQATIDQLEHPSLKATSWKSFLNLVDEVQGTPSVTMNASFDDPCMILYTSGTTGRPKGALITHKMLFWNSINTGLRLDLTQQEVILTFAPFFHTGGWNVLTTPVLHRGGKVILLKKFDADQVLLLSDSERATILFGVPTMMQMMADSPAFTQTTLESIRYAIVGGEPMPIYLIETWNQKGVPIRQGYGLTEFGPNVFSLNEEDAIRKIGSVGFPNFYIETRIVNDNDEEVPVNEIGELLLKGPVCTTGYWNNEKATNETIQNGWLRTGDLVRKDEEGYFYIVDRKKDMIISGAENIYPAEIEHVLREHPLIKEAAVIGVPHEQWGEVGHAFYSTSNASSVSVDDLQAFCKQRLAKFKIPKFFTHLEDLPKSDSGKILKRNLTDLTKPQKTTNSNT
ncbi:MAG: long-chain fatty acid--CoA ligase [Bacteroidota bacterium]